MPTLSAGAAREGDSFLADETRNISETESNGIGGDGADDNLILMHRLSMKRSGSDWSRCQEQCTGCAMTGEFNRASFC